MLQLPERLRLDLPDALAGDRELLADFLERVVGVHAKQGVLATGALCLAGIVWAIAAPSSWFLLSFGLMGAGELYGTYYPNYIMV